MYLLKLANGMRHTAMVMHERVLARYTARSQPHCPKK